MINHVRFNSIQLNQKWITISRVGWVTNNITLIFLKDCSKTVGVLKDLMDVFSITVTLTKVLRRDIVITAIINLWQKVNVETVSEQSLVSNEVLKLDSLQDICVYSKS